MGMEPFVQQETNKLEQILLGDLGYTYATFTVLSIIRFFYLFIYFFYFFFIF